MYAIVHSNKSSKKIFEKKVKQKKCQIDWILAGGKHVLKKFLNQITFAIYIYISLN